MSMSRSGLRAALVLCILLSVPAASAARAALRFVDPAPLQLSEQSEDVAVELRLPNGADPESLLVKLDGELLEAPSLTVDGKTVTTQLSGLEEGWHELKATVQARGKKRRASRRFEIVALENADDCEVLNGVECILPFPSSRFEAPADSLTGVEVAFPEGSLPVFGEGPLSSSAFGTQDGFSPAAQVIMHFPGGVDLAASKASRLLESTRSYGSRSLKRSSPTLLLDLDDGSKRLLHFLENDAQSDDPDRTVTFLRPGENLKSGHRHAVAVRGLVAPGGQAVVAEPAFAALRDGRPTTIAAIEARRPAMEKLFRKLGKAGVKRSELILAFDFTVQSTEDLTRAMLAMRDRSFDWLAAQEGPTFEVFEFGPEPEEEDDPVVSTENDCGEEGVLTWRVVRGTYEVPLFLDSDPLLDPVTGGRLVDDDEDGLPDIQGTLDANFSIAIPCAVLEDGGAPLAAVVTGHGLFGDGDSTVGVVELLNRRGQEYFGESFERIAGGTDWLGLSSNEFDIGAVFGGQPVFILDSVILDPNNFGTLPDRLRQGVTNTLVLARMMKEGAFNVDPAFQLEDETGVFAGPEAELDYFGISLGGIMGLMTSALSPDLTHIAADVPASNFAIMMQRSTAISLVASALDAQNDDPIAQAIFFGLAEELWDSAESSGYLRNITRDPLPGAGDAKDVLMTVARFDGVVPNVASEIAARTLKLPNLRNAKGTKGSAWGDLVGIPDVFKLDASRRSFKGALVVYDLGMYDSDRDPALDAFKPALENRPPVNIVGLPLSSCDPHGRSFTTPAAVAQITGFLQPGGGIANTCDGVCDSLHPVGGFSLIELDNDRSEPCDPRDD